jgi:molybdopterin-containing oxidoreductase family iron-sulfur binding subunit
MTDGMKRRDFLRVVGTGGAAASVVGCSTERVEKLLPYVVPEEEITPGVATWYTSVCGECPSGCGIWIRTREGRVVKVEGNPGHPVSGGALCSRGYSSPQGLYNPDRFSSPMVRENGELRPATWEEAEALLAQKLQEGDNHLFLTGRTGPSLRDLMDNFVSAVGGTRVEYEGLSEAPLREATRIAFGRNVVPSFDFAHARLVFSFGADFLETWLSPVQYQREFAMMAGVDEHGSKGRMVFLAPRLSLTGQNADEWIPLRPGSEAVVALAMAHVIAAEGGDPGPFQAVLDAYDPRSAQEASGVPAEEIETLARDFASQVPSLAVGPGVAGHHRNATAANLAVMILNSVAGNVGRTLRLQSVDQAAPARPFAELRSAMRAMERAGVIMVHGTNPAYSVPTSAGFREAFASAGFRVSFASGMDETAALCDLVLPDRHFLEAWGDSSPRPGLYALQQPAMQPVPHFDSKQTGDVLLSVATRMEEDLGAASFFDYLQGRWDQIRGLATPRTDFGTFWRESLRKGVVELPGTTEGLVPLRSPDTALSFDVPALDGDGDLTLTVHPSPRFGDGKHADRPWLQELPDPVSKMAWHSWLEVNPGTADELGLEDGDVVRVRSPHGEVEVPVWRYPGIREDTVALAMGGGHGEYGRFASGKGVNPMDLLPGEVEQPSGALLTLATRVSLEATGSRRPLATIEGSADQYDRPIAPAVTLAALGHGGEAASEGETHDEGTQQAGGGQEGVHEPETGQGQEGAGHQEAGQEEEAHGEETHGEAGHGHGELKELQAMGGFAPVPTEGRPEDFPLEGSQYGQYDPEAYPRWAMAIDLDKCTGCSACVTACQSENNVPWVGEEQVAMGRDMHWIRLERYYETVDASGPGPVDVRFLPMLCQHCGNAPCEPVCPVYAAYHTPGGLNAQVYNRCVGTRYCANNCPYKVRVFNWYGFSDVPEPLQWAFNPDVTVRSNGVMEKCSFCVQRIRDAENRARVEGQRPVRDGEVVPACQQSCPAEAIVFGNIRDPHSRVAQISQNQRNYRVLDKLINTQPAVTYLKKVTFHEVDSGEH